MTLEDYISEAVSGRKPIGNRGRINPKELIENTSPSLISNEISKLTGYNVKKTFTVVSKRVYDKDTILIDESGSFHDYVYIPAGNHLYCICFNGDIGDFGIDFVSVCDVEDTKHDYVIPNISTSYKFDRVEDGISELLKDIY